MPDRLEDAGGEGVERRTDPDGPDLDRPDTPGNEGRERLRQLDGDERQSGEQGAQSSDRTMPLSGLGLDAADQPSDDKTVQFSGSGQRPEDETVQFSGAGEPSEDKTVQFSGAGEPLQDETVQFSGTGEQSRESAGPAGNETRQPDDNTVPPSDEEQPLSDKTMPLGGLGEPVAGSPASDRTMPLSGLGEPPGESAVGGASVPAGDDAVPSSGPGDSPVDPGVGVPGGDRTVSLSGLGDPGVGGDTTMSLSSLGDSGVGGDRTMPVSGLGDPGVGGDRTMSLSGLGDPGAGSPGSDTTMPVSSLGDSGVGGDRTMPLSSLGDPGVGGDRTMSLSGLGDPGAGSPGGDRTMPLSGLGGPAGQVGGARQEFGGQDGSGRRRGWLAGLGQGWERLRHGRDRLDDTNGGQQAADRLERLKASRAGEGVGRLREWGDEHPIARRRLLIAVPSAAGLALVAGAVEAETGSTKPAAPRPTARAIVSQRPVPPTEKATVHALPVQRKPVFTLSDYRRLTGAPPFPADAIALTIDDGPHPVWTPKILRLLDKYHVPAMFCMIGNQVLGHEDVAGMVTRAGHQLANHTWSHPSALAGLPAAQVRREIERAQGKIRQTTGYAPKLFRSPGGAWSPTVFQEAAHAGLIPLDWTDDPRDWSRPGVPYIRSKLMAARPGQILLCHDGGGDRSQTYAALSTVIPALAAKGLRFVAL